jgi:sporulation protein YtfJ
MSDISEIIKASLESIKAFSDTQAVMGDAINTPAGITIIPISKLTVGFVGGGADYVQKKLSHVQNFGGGSGVGLSITPMALLTVTPDACVNIIPINEKKQLTDKFFSFIEHSPDIIDRIKSIML